MAMFSHRETKQPNPTPLPATPSRQNQVGTPGDEGGDERSYANTNGTSPKTGAGVSNATNENGRGVFHRSVLYFTATPTKGRGTDFSK